MVKPTDQETPAIEEIACCSQIPSEGGSHATTAPRGSTRIGQEAEGGETWARAFVVASVGRNGRGRVSRFRIGEFG